MSRFKDLKINVVSVEDRLIALEEAIDKRVSNTVSFGIEYLDKAAQGIYPTDLVVVSAPTGAGKSELVSTIAMNAARSGNKVCMFALEADISEIEGRIWFKKASQHYMKYNSEPVTYHEFLQASYCGSFRRSLEAVRPELISELKNFTTFYREKKFDITRFRQVFNSVAKTYDLFIIDHLHYFDLEGDRNENREFGDIVKEIRDLSIFHSKPVVLVSHLRKKASGVTGMPTLDDLMGTSDIAKVATKVINLYPDQEGSDPSRGMFSTFIRVLKNRYNGAACRYVGRTDFDTSTNSYLPKGSVGYIDDEKKFRVINDRMSLPVWLR